MYPLTFDEAQAGLLAVGPRKNDEGAAADGDA